MKLTGELRTFADDLDHPEGVGEERSESTRTISQIDSSR
jgi:hypothetical protein